MGSSQDPSGGIHRKITTLTLRQDFLAASRAPRVASSTMVVQGRDRRDGDDSVRVGFTCSKKLGNAVARNRAKRRLRAAAREVLRDNAVAGWDYVLIGRKDNTADQPFETLRRDLAKALKSLQRRA